MALLLAFPPGFAAAQELGLAEVTRLRDEGKVFFDQAGNTDLSRSERNKNLKQAYEVLTKAFDLLDKWCDEHPDDADRYEDMIVEIHRMRYFIRKESPINLLDDDEKNVRKGKPPDWPDKPPEDEEPARPEPGGAAPARPEPGPRADPIAEHLEFAKKFEQEHPYDRIHARDLYLDLLEHAAPGSAAYEYALGKVSAINQELKEAYRLLRGDELDSLELAGAEERKIVHALSKDLESGEREVRLRAAEYLGRLCSGDGARHLAMLLEKEKDAEIRDMVLSSLAKIGGAKTCADLGDLGSSRNEAVQQEALTILETVARRSQSEARYASEAIGRFVTAKSDTVADQAVSALAAMGPNGIYGLLVASAVKDHERRLAVIRALGETGDGRAAGCLGPYLMRGVSGKGLEHRTAAEEACKKIGKSVTPYLARFLGNPSAAVYIRYVLREITGQHFKTEAAAKAWWERNK
jgi:HEAT repeat protein